MSSSKFDLAQDDTVLPPLIVVDSNIIVDRFAGAVLGDIDKTTTAQFPDSESRARKAADQSKGGLTNRR